MTTPAIAPLVQPALDPIALSIFSSRLEAVCDEMGAVLRNEFPISEGRNFRLNTQDFGGQQIYHATHQFFLTKRSLYVLVDNTRSDHLPIYDEGFKFWMEVVETLSECSPLLIFQNEKGGRSKPIDEVGIKGRSQRAGGPPGQPGRSGCSGWPTPGSGIPRPAVTTHRRGRAGQVGLHSQGPGRPLAQSRPYISLDEYFKVYDRHLEPDHDKALHLNQYLHDLGVFIHFQQPRELRRTVFLQNQWVTEAAVFRILDDEHVKSQRGRFTLTDCDRLWSGGYANKDVELRALMVRFELCYRLPDAEEETWLVPQHLSPSKLPALSDWAKPGDLVLTYRYEFLPKGLVSQLMVWMHHFVQRLDLCWSRGALFEHEGTQVLVETTARGNEVALRGAAVRNGRNLLSVIASDLDALNDSFLGLKDKVGKWVPCICDTCTKTTTPEFFAHKGLLKRLAKALGRDRVFYDEWYEARLLGIGGDLKLQDFYERAELVVPFFSEHYTKPWCSLEWETIRGILLKRRKDDAVTPIHLDDTEMPGWPAVGFGIKPKGRSTEEIADLILEAYRQRHPTR